MKPARIVLDTNVLHAGLYSASGASYQVLRAIERGDLKPVLSTALLFEYEEVLKRNRKVLKLSGELVEEILDELCARSEHRRIHFLWRPQLADPKDDHILELAVASGADAIVTHNAKHFRGASALGPKVMSPGQLLEELK